VVSRGQLPRFAWRCLLLILATASACSPHNTSNGQVCFPPDRLEAEEYAVLSAVICTEYVKEDVRLIVIKDRTCKVGPRLIENTRELMPDIPSGLLADFEAKNLRPSSLRQLLTLPTRYSLVPLEKLTPIFWLGEDRGWDLIHGPKNLIYRPDEGPRGWELFYQLYPHSQGIMTLSIPGFTEHMDSSLVYVGNQNDYLSGAGFIALLTKENGAWIIKREVILWVS
jgi:hypothetical protein